ncbi:hypothetical protein AAE045_18285 [Dryocola clanedunensis]
MTVNWGYKAATLLLICLGLLWSIMLVNTFDVSAHLVSFLDKLEGLNV